MNNKQEIISHLRERIGAIEWARDEEITAYPLGIPAIDNALRYGGITAGSCHEIISAHDATALGFVLLLLSAMVKKGPVIWCSSAEDFYTPGFAQFGIKDTDIIFVNVNDHQQALWAAETALRCTNIAGIVLHAQTMSLAEGRRIKLLAQQHMTTALFLVKREHNLLPTIAATRWRIRHEPSLGLSSRNGIKTVGAPRLAIQLMRNLYGLAPLSWTVEFDEHTLRFHTVSPLLPSTEQERRMHSARQRVA